MSSWRSLPLLLLLAALLAFEEWASTPSCQTSTPAPAHPDDLKVMLVADLLLPGPEARPSDLYFRYSYTAKFFRKSFKKLQPDMLVVLGDISARGAAMSKSGWLDLLRKFQRMLGPFLGLPLHVVLGDRDVGDCRSLDATELRQITNNLPGLDSAGCGAFEIGNVSFVSLNAVAMLCGSNAMRFHVETAIERESVEVHTRIKEGVRDVYERTMSYNDVQWRGNLVASGSGPVLLQHFPLHRGITGTNAEDDLIRRNIEAKNYQNNLWRHSDHDIDGSAPYNLEVTLPYNETEYIFQSIRPRMVFSAHSHHFFDKTHGDGTREVTVPAMSWAARDDPGFVVATFGQNRTVIVTRCFLARESHVLMAYFSVLTVLLSTVLFMSRSHLISRTTAYRTLAFLSAS